MRKIGDFYAWVFGWSFLSRVHKVMFHLSGRALGLFNYSSDRISGERHAITLGLADKEAPVVFDVGANVGDWTAQVLSLRPKARIHAFEPQSRLATGIAVAHPRVKVNNMALGEMPGRLQLADYAQHEGSQHASLLRGVIDGIHQGAVRYTEVPVGTLDDYCAENFIEHIDLLKVDVEGFEVHVFRGAKRLLSEHRIDVIQFEFNEMNIVGRTFLGDFYKSLGETHDLYRLLPHGLLRLKQNSHWYNEQFVYQNIIALRRR
jgi:FkbM family methyltransferase